jgi:GDP-L-fucose synthase
MNLNDKIYIAGHRGLVGSAIVRQLESRGFSNFLMRTHKELDLTNQAQVKTFFEQEKPDYVILAAAKVGGIHANNTYPADFIYQNMMIEANVINSAYENKVKRLLFLGSTCIYPKEVKQPMREDALLTDTLEPTNEPQIFAQLCQQTYMVLMITSIWKTHMLSLHLCDVFMRQRLITMLK